MVRGSDSFAVRREGKGTQVIAEFTTRAHLRRYERDVRVNNRTAGGIHNLHRNGTCCNLLDNISGPAAFHDDDPQGWLLAENRLHGDRGHVSGDPDLRRRPHQGRRTGRVPSGRRRLLQALPVRSHDLVHGPDVDSSAPSLGRRRRR